MRIDHFGIFAPYYEQFIRPKKPEALLENLNLPIDGMILDAGGGTGRVAQFLVGQASQIMVADQSCQMLREVQNKDGLLAACSDTEWLPFADASFERIMMVDAFHHVSVQAKTANELWRILKPSGRLVIEEPDIRSFRVKLIALGEKLALMRSHFLYPAQIAGMFSSSAAHVQIRSDDSSVWIIVEKDDEPRQ